MKGIFIVLLATVTLAGVIVGCGSRGDLSGSAANVDFVTTTKLNGKEIKVAVELSDRQIALVKVKNTGDLPIQSAQLKFTCYTSDGQTGDCPFKKNYFIPIRDMEPGEVRVMTADLNIGPDQGYKVTVVHLK